MIDTIHPQLVKAGNFAKVVFRPNRFLFKVYHWLTNQKPESVIDGFENETHHVARSSANGDVRVRVYRPEEQNEDLPVLLYFHGGGYIINSPETAHLEISHFLKACPCVVVAPDYTKTVHAPYPAAINDCEDTLDWLLQNSKTLRVRTDKLIIGGHSAGGGLTVALLLRLRERGDVSVAYQMPIYPMLDHRSNTASARDNDMPIWNTKFNKLAWKMYLGVLHGLETAPMDAAPTQAEHYKGLPPGTTFVGSLDPFLDETLEYVIRLRREKIDCDIEVYDQCYHAFDIVVPDAEPSLKAIEFMQKSFANAVANHTAPQPE